MGGTGTCFSCRAGSGARATVSERQAKLLFDEGRHPTPWPSRRSSWRWGSPRQLRGGRRCWAGRSATSPRRLALDLVVRPPPTVHVLWALADEGTRLLIEDCQDGARDGALGWMTDVHTAAQCATGGRRPTPSLTPP
ncbi:relaxase domain-containing protein [Streptomyces sp. NPDC056192]|uniref:relaxase domain-containing protein n=1 Tax=Streptomyces sp. NPDC056192 TaxID=3345743 RepID=UPI0035D93A5B